jgi:hypothetical protein
MTLFYFLELENIYWVFTTYLQIKSLHMFVPTYFDFVFCQLTFLSLENKEVRIKEVLLAYLPCVTTFKKVHHRH